MKRPLVVRTLTCLFASLVVTACQLPLIRPPIPTATAEQTVELSFETIELSEPSKPDYWIDEKPGLLIIASSQAITQASQYISDGAIATLQHMNFADAFALLAFHGRRGNLHDGFEILKVIKQNEHVYVFTRPTQEGPQAIVSSPYHLISIKKNGDWGQTFVFHLYSGVNISADQMNDQPQLFLLTAPNEIALIQDQVNPETLLQLRNVNIANPKSAVRCEIKWPAIVRTMTGHFASWQIALWQTLTLPINA